MAFTVGELANIANQTLDFYIKGKPLAQSIQDKPLLKAFKAAQKGFPGGKEYITSNVKGDYSTYFAGYTHDDSVAYQNPANVKQVQFDWKELHGGISITHSELKKAGISVVDTDGKKTTEHSEREKILITDLFQDKLDDMTEGMARDMNNYFLLDGSGDAKGPVGVLAYLTTTASTGTTGGLSRASNTWWRHRYTGSINTTSTDLPLFLMSEYRMLRKFGGRPDLWLAGSDFLEALENQLYDKGYYTLQGFSKSDNAELGMADITFKGNKIVFDPTMDDNGLTKTLLVIDTRRMYPRVMDGEDMKQHSPSRPAEKMVMYRGVTWTGNLVVDQLNCHGRYAIA